MADGPGEHVAGPGGPGASAEPGSHGPGPGGDEAAELAWRMGEDVDPPVTIVVDGREYDVGAGPPEARVEMTLEQLRAAAAAAESAEDRDLTN